MTSDKKNISLLADIFVKSGLSDIVISPGSRNAPIITSFANRKGVNAFSIVDERSAAFFALGIALKTKKAVAIACTSGSAVLNYSSAISEAFYQKIPLLVLTADRPPHLIDVGDGQTIKQENVFNNFVKKSFQLPLEITTQEEKLKAETIINEAINACHFPQAGPVHINIPFDEPLYQTTVEQIEGNLIHFENQQTETEKASFTKIVNACNGSSKIMIIAGQSVEKPALSKVLEAISLNKNIVVLSETTSNLHGLEFIGTIDNMVSTLSEKESKDFAPEVLITFGGQVVSKMIKKFLRNHKPLQHWHISPSGERLDTYFSLTDAVRTDEVTFFNSLLENLATVESSYAELWTDRKTKVERKKKEYLSKTVYSDFKVFESIMEHLPSNSILHLGNSTPVRYSQLFGSKQGVVYNSNRGVSGIDGQVSTAAGYAFNSDKLNVLITGDLGFLYDSNALMNNYLKPNLKIIIINNSGGGIFRFIPGPDSTPNLEEFFATKHNWKAEHICKAFNVGYSKVENLKELEYELPNFFNNNNNREEVLEIFTPPEKNAEVLREYFKFIRS